ncbi:MAG: hypothetical protein LKF36_15280 [Lactobacillus sp.]|jgi:hypothetical protein|nr:hypothetical protein [Lactobacillus sp.]
MLIKLLNGRQKNINPKRWAEVRLINKGAILTLDNGKIYYVSDETAFYLAQAIGNVDLCGWLLARCSDLVESDDDWGWDSSITYSGN